MHDETVGKYLLLSLRWVYKLIESLCRVMWQKHSQLKVNISFSSVIPPPKNYFKDKYANNIRLFISAIFVIAKEWECNTS